MRPLNLSNLHLLTGHPFPCLTRRLTDFFTSTIKGKALLQNSSIITSTFSFSSSRPRATLLGGGLGHKIGACLFLASPWSVAAPLETITSPDVPPSLNDKVTVALKRESDLRSRSRMTMSMFVIVPRALTLLRL